MFEPKIGNEKTDEVVELARLFQIQTRIIRFETKKFEYPKLNCITLI